MCQYVFLVVFADERLLNWLTLNNLASVGVLSCLNSVWIQAAATWLWWFPTLYVAWCWCSTSWLLLWMCTSIKGKNVPLHTSPTCLNCCFGGIILYSWKAWVFLILCQDCGVIRRSVLENLHAAVDNLHLCAGKKNNLPSVCFSSPAKSFQEAEGKRTCFHFKQTNWQHEKWPPYSTSTVDLIQSFDMLARHGLVRVSSRGHPRLLFHSSRKSGWLSFKHATRHFSF